MSRQKIIQACLDAAEKTLGELVQELEKKNNTLDLRGETAAICTASFAMISQNRAIILMLKDLSERMELVETSLGIIRDANK